jgi:hypothetical protein
MKIIEYENERIGKYTHHPNNEHKMCLGKPIMGENLARR